MKQLDLLFLFCMGLFLTLVVVSTYTDGFEGFTRYIMGFIFGILFYAHMVGDDK
jgi:hypothetical protein